MGKINFDCLFSELVITFSRSSGKGGQHVNKVATKAELAFDVKSVGLFKRRAQATR
jgi:ribosome-associated protein